MPKTILSCREFLMAFSVFNGPLMAFSGEVHTVAFSGEVHTVAFSGEVHTMAFNGEPVQHKH